MDKAIYQKDKITRVQVKLKPNEEHLKENLEEVKISSRSTLSKLIMNEVALMLSEA